MKKTGIDLMVTFSLMLIIFLNMGLTSPEPLSFPMLFVSRQIPCCGSVYMSEAKALPGVGNFSKYQVAAPGYLCILQTNGKVDTLINGAKPALSSMFLIDVSAPSLSYDAKSIVFAGLVDGIYHKGNANQYDKEHNAWRIYTIDINGRNLKKITGLANIPGSDPVLDLSQFRLPSPNGPLAGYDDTDPIFLPDGRICFSSTRYPGFAMYNAGRSSNLFVVNSDGTDVHRITSEKNGADRPVVDPLTGKIVFARWWRNFYWPYDGMETVRSVQYPEGYLYKDGLTSDLNSVINGQTYMFNNNSFLLTEINPDGTDLKIFSMWFRDNSANGCYGGNFDLDGNFIGNWFPIEHVTESSGFGGIKKYFRNAINAPEGLLGTYSYGNLDYYKTNPTSYGIFKGEYAAEPYVLPDGKILVSIAPDPNQDYGIYLVDNKGKNREKIVDNPGTTELRAQLVMPRNLPPVIKDRNFSHANALPPKIQSNLFDEGKFIFDCRNIFFNAPVDHPAVSAPKIGEVESVRFFAAPQREQQHGSVEALDYPWLYDEIQVDEFGRVLNINSPAHLPLFEQARSSRASGYKIPRTGGGIMDGAAHVTGFNYGRPGEKVSCVGCHAGHSAIPIPQNAEDLLFTNLAPGARIRASSSMSNPGYVIDRKNKSSSNFWFTPEGISPEGQRLDLNWLVPIYVKKIRLYNIPDPNRLVVNECVLRLYEDSARINQIKEFIINQDLNPKGTELTLDNIIKIQGLQLEFKKVTGGIYHWNCASIGEIEVIASHISPDRFSEIEDCRGIVYGEFILDTCGRCLHPSDPEFNKCLTSSNTATEISNVKVFPNPANDHFIIQKLNREFDINFEIYGMTGRRMTKGRLDRSQTLIDIAEWPRGTYLLNLNNSQQSAVMRIIKL
ncbi:MAG: T9SS type A sorting domain-containing protein [Saprospiraceae bacterium]|nr:T9SS type A sorting domain-containing protein [Saprospiraceae bacterium]HMW40628.1 T9SS type A sorting domain-containing protein [Saprospiraceae bacterium]HMZ41369.1 T9SS type A sorting domain-containing protein [Saprospiraceae bacterium]HNB31619.1 T9SS type A sorting domain-containing protein [Saprospiraceae bacterium]HNC37499.1 T9SS type A sorting domain-containing protein [Saprospiraceae bacterium]